VIRRLLFLLAALFLAGLAPAGPCLAEDGYQLWLRYPPLPAQQRERARDRLGSILVPASRSPAVQAAMDELQRGLAGLLEQPLPLTDQPRDGTILLGTPDTLPLISQLDLPLGRLGPEGYIVRSVEIGGHATTVIAANGDAALVYGVFALLRLLQTDATLDRLDTLDVLDRPAVQLRVLNHWDNLDRSVERGYAGQSIWDWWRLPDFHDPRYTDYARANASIGINGTVLNNVNAQAEVLTAPYLAKAAALADVFRPYGIRVYLSVRFSSPVDIGGLTTADPLDPTVRVWWRAKADEIYALIPDFGGFLVKANSEGQPGPQNYGRSHADGANLLADTLRPHGGNVMWRAFVYSQDDPEDRVRQAYTEFKPLDGTFADNVLVQVKNGPLDFQPREPFHPLFGAMPGTPLMLEFQITQEYLGFSTHLVYLGALYEEVLTADTFAAGAGSTVARVIDSSLHGYARAGIAGVANIGSDRDWSGSTFAQANWYAFGRLAWDPRGSARAIAEEWLRMTFSNDPRFVQPAAELMMRSHQAAVDYMTPLGLAHLMGTGHHYGPAPWVDDLERPEWNPYYYHRADAQGIGLDRTERGSDAVAHYARPVARRLADLQSVPDDFLLWFHRLPWDHRMRSGATLWEELVARYDRGITEVEAMRDAWAGLQPFVDAERFAKTRDFLDIQLREARWWRDACLAYFMHQSGRELPPGTRPPAESLEYYRSLEFPHPPGW
jgi:alpha-glucuronidase